MRHLADDDKREDYPLYDGLFAYFPAALLEVARWSKVGNDKHNPGEPLHWAREKSTDHENKILRHLIDARESMGDDGSFVEATALAWRALALLQTILEERGAPSGANGKWLKEKHDPVRIDSDGDGSETIYRGSLFDGTNETEASEEDIIDYLSGRLPIPEGQKFTLKWPFDSLSRVDHSKSMGVHPIRVAQQSQQMASQVRSEGESEAGILGN